MGGAEAVEMGGCGIRRKAVEGGIEGSHFI